MRRGVWLLSGDRFTWIVQCLHAQALLNTQPEARMCARDGSGLSFLFPLCVIKHPLVKKQRSFLCIKAKKTLEEHKKCQKRLIFINRNCKKTCFCIISQSNLRWCFWQTTFRCCRGCGCIPSRSFSLPADGFTFRAESAHLQPHPPHPPQIKCHAISRGINLTRKQTQSGSGWERGKKGHFV